VSAVDAAAPPVTTTRPIPSPGSLNVDWEERWNVERMRSYRLGRARAALAASDLGAVLLFDFNNIRYTTSTHIGEWARDKMTRYALLTRGGEPHIWDFGSAAKHHRLNCPWLPQENVHAGMIGLRGAVAPDAGLFRGAARELAEILRTEGVGGMPLGLGDGTRIVVYDNNRYSASARAWWMLRLFGHPEVAVLDGGLAKWLAEGRPVDDRPVIPREAHFTARQNNLLLRDLEQIRANLVARREQVVDARPGGRFAGSEPEPRAGLRGGHIPQSLNLPHLDLVAGDGTLLPPAELRARFEAQGIDPRRPIVTTCGSGVTACTVALALHQLGAAEVAVLVPDEPRLPGKPAGVERVPLVAGTGELKHAPQHQVCGVVELLIHALYLEVLDQGVGEQLLAELRDAIRVLGLELDHAADPHVLDPLEAERRQRPLHRLALGVEDPLLGPDQHARLRH